MREVQPAQSERHLLTVFAGDTTLRPYVGTYFEGCKISASIGFERDADGETFGIGCDIDLRPTLADVLVLVWPAVDLDNRRYALWRLLGRRSRAWRLLRCKDELR